MSLRLGNVVYISPFFKKKALAELAEELQHKWWEEKHTIIDSENKWWEEDIEYEFYEEELANLGLNDDNIKYVIGRIYGN